METTGLRCGLIHSLELEPPDYTSPGWEDDAGLALPTPRLVYLDAVDGGLVVASLGWDEVVGWPGSADAWLACPGCGLRVGFSDEARDELGLCVWRPDPEAA